MQVASLAEEATLKVGGHSLLVRAGALYHDIGKMENPQYFIENLHDSSNPHNELDERSSAKLIIGHVLKGVEIGIGTGRFALPLGIQDGVEPSAAMREIATRNGLLVYDGIAEYLPLADQSYDFALMVTTVCFVDNVKKSFRDINRILKPRGRFVVGLVDENSPLGAEYQKIKKSSRFYHIATFYSTDQVIASLSDTGFEDIEVVQTVFGNLDSIREVQPFTPGHGEGGFVAIKAVRKPGFQF